MCVDVRVVVPQLLVAERLRDPCLGGIDEGVLGNVNAEAKFSVSIVLL